MNKQELEGLKRIQNYFGEHDKTPFEHWAFRFLGGIIKNLDAVEAMPESEHDSTCIRCNKSGIQSEWHKVGAERESGYGGDPICDECYSNLMDEDLAVEAMGVQQESEHNPNLHNLDITHTGVCSKCGGTNLMDAPSPAPAKAVEAMPDEQIKKELVAYFGDYAQAEMAYSICFNRQAVS